MKLQTRGAGLFFAGIGVLFLRSLFTWSAGFYNTTPDWINNYSLLIVDRLIYAILVAGVGYFLYFTFFPVLLLERPNREFGPIQFFKRNRHIIISLIPGLISGILMFVLLYFYLEFFSKPVNTSPDSFQLEIPDKLFVFIIYTGIITPLLEEIFYRGVLQRFLLKFTDSVLIAIVIQALFFALAHNINAAPVMIPVGLVFGILYWRFGLASSILAHMVYNTLILLHSRYQFM